MWTAAAISGGRCQMDGGLRMINQARHLSWMIACAVINSTYQDTCKLQTAYPSMHTGELGSNICDCFLTAITDLVCSLHLACIMLCISQLVCV